jgi:cbb3-type cytochrome oxidase subunit 3
MKKVMFLLLLGVFLIGVYLSAFSGCSMGLGNLFDSRSEKIEYRDPKELAQSNSSNFKLNDDMKKKDLSTSNEE